MSCTTILVGKKASYDGSTIIARDDDSGSGRYDPKKFIAVAPQDQPRHYRSVLSHVEIDLPDNPCRYSIVPNVLPNRGILAEAGVNERNVAMSATETIAVNERVLAADPLVELQPANEAADTPEIPGGIGEEDIITLVLPYVTTAREGVARLAELLETYGTYESNGIIISDVNEIWYVETIGGHHWIARRVPDDCYATIPNQLGIDDFDFDDAFSTQREFMCSADLREFMDAHHLDRTMSAGASSGFGFQPTSVFGNASMNGGGNSSSGAALGHNHFNPRTAFGTATTKDRIYNTPRAWYMQRHLNPSEDWDSPAARYTPASDDIPWCRVPENAVTLEDVDFLMSAHFEGTLTIRTVRSGRRKAAIATVRSASTAPGIWWPCRFVRTRRRQAVRSCGSHTVPAPSPRPRRSMRTSTIRPPTCVTPRRKSRPATCTGRTV